MNKFTDLHFTYKIILSILTKKSIFIENCSEIGKKSSFLRLISKLCKNTKYKIKDRIIDFKPGKIIGGTLEYTCTDDIYNYIDPLLILLPFAGKKSVITFKGVTDNINTVDTIKVFQFKIMNMFGICNTDIKIKRRGFYPDGEGEVVLECGVVKELQNINCIESYNLEKTTALLTSSRLNSTYIHDMSDVCKELIGDLNLKVIFNICNRNDAGPSPGFQSSIISESKNGGFFSTKTGGTRSPKDVAKDSVFEFLKSINKGGMFDYKMTHFLVTFLALSPSNFSQIRICKPTKDTRLYLDVLSKLTNFKFKIKKVDNEYIFASCGLGYININISLIRS